MIATITQDLLNNLRRTALAATPGEWSAFIDMRSGTFAVHTPDDERKGNVVGWTGFDGDARSSKKQAAANARHVAAANPAVILALTDIAQNSLQSQEAQHPDDIAVDRFAAAMKEKLKLAREKGRGGWEQCDPADLSDMLRDHVEKGDPRDVANFSMFLWSLGKPICASPSPAVANEWKFLTWPDALAISEQDGVDEALSAFIDDSTEEAAVAVVIQIATAVLEFQRSPAPTASEGQP